MMKTLEIEDGDHSYLRSIVAGELNHIELVLHTTLPPPLVVELTSELRACRRIIQAMDGTDGSSAEKP